MILYPHAKVNLCLHITGRKENGYHTLDTVFLPVSLFDTLVAEPAGCFSFRCSDPALENDNNLVCRAWRKLEECGELPPQAVYLDKKIPSQAGLGGGSADAAALLRLGQHLSGGALTKETVLRIAAKLGADVPALLCDGPARGLDTGTELIPVPCGKALPLLIIKPALSLSTPAMYRAWDEKFGDLRRPCRLPETDALLAALEKGDIRGVAEAMHNDFEDVLPAEAAGPIRQIKKELMDAGAAGSLLTGSGSAVFGLFETEAARDAALAALSRGESGWALYPCEGFVPPAKEEEA